ncbi:DUF3344 domain-containing protein [Streptomyces sp. NPDC048639]|uniref:DUF3344 domain-containing protein n=1 Tax=Streptomyces sp. NPDC048639 TaxID=3365581 RepID=UPI003719D784
MRVNLVRGGRYAFCALSAVAVAVVLPQSVAVPAGKEATQVPFVERYRAVEHGGIVRAANVSATCESAVTKAAVSCAQVQKGGAGRNNNYEMTYVDVDKDANTYNSSRADLRLPKNATVTYARLYWGGNLLAGEHKPAKDNGRVLFAEPGGEYKEVIADTTMGHRNAEGADAYAASADVTDIVRYSNPGAFTVGQINIAKGHSKPGTYGGWTLVVAYSDPGAPLRTLSILDGFQTVNAARPDLFLDLEDLNIPKNGKGVLGVVSYDGDRGLGKNALAVARDAAAPVALRDAANPADDAMNSTITNNGKPAPGRQPAHVNTLGFDSDVFDLKSALKPGADELTVGFGTKDEGYHLGALFLQADTRR